MRNGENAASFVRLAASIERLPHVGSGWLVDGIDRNPRHVGAREDEITVMVQGAGRCAPFVGDEPPAPGRALCVSVEPINPSCSVLKPVDEVLASPLASAARA